jgi:hypothetical protein
LQLDRLDEQLRRLNWQRKQKIAELEREVGRLRQAAELFSAQVEHQQGFQQSVTTLSQATQRLRKQGIIEEPDALQRAIDHLERELQSELVRHRQQADLLRLQIWQQGVGS